MRVRSQHQGRAQLVGLRQGVQLLVEPRVVAGHAGGVDQHGVAIAQQLQHLAQAVAVVGRVHAHAEQAAVVFQLRGRADAVVVGADQGDLIGAVAHHRAGGQLGDGGGLAHAGGTDQGGDHRRIVSQRAAAHRQTAAEHAQRQVARLLGIDLFGQVVDQRTRHVGLDADAGHLAQHARAQRLAPLQVVPGQAGQLHFQHLAHAAQLVAQARRVLRGAFHQRRGHYTLGDRRGRRRLDAWTTRRRRCHRGRRRGRLRHRRARRRCRGRRGDVRQRRWWRLGRRTRGALARRFAHQRLVVIQRRDDLDALGNAPRRQDHRLVPLLLAHLAHRLTHVGGHVTFDFHGCSLRSRESGTGNRESVKARALQGCRESGCSDALFPIPDSRLLIAPTPVPNAPDGCRAPRCRPVRAGFVPHGG